MSDVAKFQNAAGRTEKDLATWDKKENDVTK